MTSRTQKLFVVFALILIALSGGSCFANWASPVNVSNTSGYFTTTTSYAFDSSGNIHGLFYDFMDTNVGIYYFNNVGGTWTKSVFVWGAKSPEFCITPDDVMHAFYTVSDVIYETTKPVSGGSWSTPVVLSGATNGTGLPADVIVDASGGIYFAWWHLFDADMGANRSAVWGRYKPYGGSWGATELIKGTSSKDKWPMGVILATYNNQIYATYHYDGAFYRVRTSGVWGSPMTIPYSGGIGMIAFSPAGEMVVTYARDTKEDGESGLKYEVFATFSSNLGQTWSPEFQVSSNSWLSRGPIGTTYDQYNNLHITWQRNSYDGEDFDMWYRARLGGVWQSPTNITNNGGRTGASEHALAAFCDTLWYEFQDNTYTNGLEDMYFTNKSLALPANTGILRGTVRSTRDNSAVVGATVTLSPGSYSATTDINGNYLVYGVPTGTYSGTASMTWFDPQTVSNIAIYDAQTTTVNFNIAPDAIPPAQPVRFAATGANAKVALVWINPSDSDFKGVRIVRKTGSYPTSPTDGTIVANSEGSANGFGMYDDTGVTNGTTYYYAAYSYDQQTNYSTSAKLMTALPNTAPYTNKLTNGALSSFTSGVANSWTSYRINDPSSVMTFASDSSNYVSSPAQSVRGIDALNAAYGTGYSAAGIKQAVTTTAGKVYVLAGYQDIYNSSYSANSTMYIHNFGIDPYSESVTAAPTGDGTLGGVQWLAPGMSFWNKSKGGAPYYPGYHRVFAGFGTPSTSLTVWSGVSVKNDKTPDSVATNFDTDQLYLYELDNPANSTGTLWNGTFESAVDYQNGGEVIPTNWIPVGGGIGWSEYTDCTVFGARSGDRGVRVGSRRGCDSRGLMQRLATSPGTSISFSAWVIGGSDTEAGVGIDPMGGTDINSPSIVWATSLSTSWTQITANATAAGSYATLFLRMKTTSSSSYDAYHMACFDDASATWTSASASRGTIAGRVKDSFGNPLNGATITTSPSSNQCVSGTAGAYTLGGVAAGTYSVTCSLANYNSQTKTGNSVTVGGTTVVKFDLTPLPGSISGVVRDTLGNPVSGATVATNSGGYTTTSASNGSYTLSNVAAGTYSVTASKTDYGPQTKTAAVGPNQAVSLDFNIIPPPGTISGTVVDNCGNPVGGATVSTSSGGYTATTAANGAYSMPGVTPATYSVTATKALYGTQTLTGITVTSYQTTTANLAITKYNWTEKLANGNFEGGFFGFWGGTIGNSWGAAFTNGSNDAEWDKYLSDGNYSQKVKTGNASTDAGLVQAVSGLTAGSPYRFAGYAYQLEAGYTVYMAVDETNSITAGSLPTNGQAFPTDTQVWKYKEVSGIVPASGTVTVYCWSDYASGTTGPVYFDNLSLLQGTAVQCTNGSITGYVRDASNNPISGATVATNSGGFTATSAADGSYAILGVTPGTYSVTASKTGWTSQTLTGVVVSSGQSTTRDFTLSVYAGTITGYVKDASNNPIVGASVTTNSGDYVASSGSDGSYTIEGVSPGTYNLTATKLGYSSQTNTGVTVTSAQTATSNFTLTSQAGTISGVVLDACNAPISGAAVATSSGGYSATTGTNGSYTLSGVIAGSYSVTASKSGYSPQTNSSVSVSAGQTTTSNFQLSGLSQQEVLVNGNFSTGFFSFWGGTIGNNWEAGFTNSANGATWGNHDFGGSYGYAQKLTNTHSTTLAGIYQRVTGLTPGATYTFSASEYQTQGGYAVYMAVDPTNSLAVCVLPSSGTAFSNIAGQWNTQSVTGTVGSGGAVAVYLWVDKTGSTNGDVYFDNISLIVGTPSSCGGTISGYVRDASSNPISGATVATNSGGYSTTSGTDGAYTLANVSAGTYNVTASKTGYNDQTNSSVAVTSGQTTTSNFNLTAASTEKVTNGDMEGGFTNTGWGSNCSSLTSRLPNSWGWNNVTSYPFNTFSSTTIKHGGSNALGFAFCSTAASPGKMGIAWQSVNLGSANATATFSVWAYHTDGNCPSIMCWNPGQNQSDPAVANTNGRYQWVTTDNWGQRNTWVSRSMTVTADSTGYVTIMVGGAAHTGTASGAKLYIDDVSVQ